MEQQIKDRFNQAILQEIMRRYHIAAGNIHELNGFESFIFEFQRDAKDYILRITHSLRRSEDLIRGEVDWINFLADGGVAVARAIPSAWGNLVETVADPQGGAFLAAAFVKAPGQRPWLRGWTVEGYTIYGQLLGKMHALSEIGVPYSAAEIAQAPEAVNGRTEMDALIAYLQGLNYQPVDAPQKEAAP